MENKYAIVGQGLAGTLLHYHLKKKGVQCVIIEGKNKSSSSKIAAGVINPISGRKFVLSWLYEDLQASFLKDYNDLQYILGETFFTRKKIIRAIENIGLENAIYEKINTIEYANYFDQEFQHTEIDSIFNPVLGYTSINGYQLNTINFLEGYESLLKQNNELIESVFKYENLILKKEKLEYEDLKFDHIIFCEGANVANNPFFNDLPFNQSKGEVLYIKIPGLNVDYLIKNKLYFVNIEEDVYWVGSGYEWKFENDKPTHDVKERMIAQLHKILQVPFTILDHKAAIRPTVKHRKPLLGTLADNDRIHIYNGLGTKGSMLAPYFAEIMASYLVEGKTLPEDVDILNVK